MSIDLFATSLNFRIPIYFAPLQDPQSIGTDALLQKWDNLQVYAFPPFSLIRARVAESESESESVGVGGFWMESESDSYEYWESESESEFLIRLQLLKSNTIVSQYALPVYFLPAAQASSSWALL